MMDTKQRESTRNARSRLRRIARREPWPLCLLEPEHRPLIDAFVLGLALGGLASARHWAVRNIKRQLPLP